MDIKNKSKLPHIAPLKNVALCLEAFERTIGRQQHLDGLIAFHGPSGFGKSYAATYVANDYNAILVQARSTWTRKAFIDAIAREIGVAVTGKTSDVVDAVAHYFLSTQRPLIIDEMDYIVSQGSVEIIRDISEMSHIPIMLIGEEKLPSKLRKWERFHGRMLPAVAAQPADADDARILAEFYCRSVQVSDDLLASLATAANGSIRRICVNLSLIEETALGVGKKVVDLGAWSAFKKGFWTGQTTERRFA